MAETGPGERVSPSIVLMAEHHVDIVIRVDAAAPDPHADRSRTSADALLWELRDRIAALGQEVQMVLEDVERMKDRQQVIWEAMRAAKTLPPGRGPKRARARPGRRVAPLLRLEEGRG